MKVAAILNPYAGRGRAARSYPRLGQLLRATGLDVTLFASDYPGHASNLAAQAVAGGFDLILAVGGDGTVGEVINGMRARPDGNPALPLAILPLGTANDLVTNLDLPRTLGAVLEAIHRGSMSAIDLGEVNGWLFANNSAVGLEPVVTLYNLRMTWLRGVIRYLVAAIWAIAGGRRWDMDLEWENGVYSGPISLVSVGNCPITGGLFRMAPAADPRDGMLTFVHGFAPSRWKMLTLLPRTIGGTYVDDPAIHQIHSRWLKISATPGTPLQADGEIRGNNETAVQYSVRPQALQIVTG